MSTECSRIADQLRRAFKGEAWHGPPLRDLLAGITAVQATARTLPTAHTIWELVLHIDLWADIAFRATMGIPMPKLYGTGKDWTKPFTGSEDEWVAAQGHLFETGERLAGEIEAFDDARLSEIVPGREYDFYHLFHGVVQHSLYHAGQIAILKRALTDAH
jgi:DinB superfamily